MPNATKVCHTLMELRKEVEAAMALHGPTVDLNYIDIEPVVSLNGLFRDSPFNGDISKWNTSNVTTMYATFQRSAFTGNISDWNVSSVKTMHSMFARSRFNGDISGWNVENVEDFSEMFSGSIFNGDISQWRPPIKSKYKQMFFKSSFKEKLFPLKPPGYFSVEEMFYKAPFPPNLMELPWTLQMLCYALTIKGRGPSDKECKGSQKEMLKEHLYPALELNALHPLHFYVAMLLNAKESQALVEVPKLERTDIQWVRKQRKWLSLMDVPWHSQQAAQLVYDLYTNPAMQPLPNAMDDVFSFPS